MFKSIKNERIKRKLQKLEMFPLPSPEVKEALSRSHALIHKLYPWPSKQLEDINRVCGYIYGRAQSERMAKEQKRDMQKALAEELKNQLELRS